MKITASSTKIRAKSVPSNFGFAIRSPHALKFLRSGGDNGIIKIGSGVPPSLPASKPLLEWTLRGNLDVSAKLYADRNTYTYWISDAGWYHVDPALGTIQIPEDGDEVVREQRLWSIPALLCAMHRGDFFLHAAAADIHGRAVLLAAPGHAGKTTLAMAFHRAGYRVISEDSACCRVAPAPAILPGPAVLRLRPDVYDGHPPAGTYVVTEREDRIYLGLDECRRGSDAPVPICALILLRDSQSEIHLDPVPSHKALPDLWSLTFHFPSDSDRGRCFKHLTALAGAIPIWNLHRPLRLASLDTTVAKIVDAVSSTPCLASSKIGALCDSGPRTALNRL